MKPEPQIPSVTIPLRFILTGVASLAAGVAWLLCRPDLLASYHYNQYIVAVTHLFVLGWIASVVMGATYQLVPVALETRLHSERLARWHFALHLIGFTGMVWMFWTWNLKQVGHFGSAFGLGVILFTYNLGRTLARVPRWNAVAFGIASSAFWLLIAMLAGLYAASAKCWPGISPFNPISLMHAHAHLGVLGCFVMMIVGASYKLVPMFVLGELRSERRACWSIGLLNAGVAGLFATLLLDRPLKLAFALVTLAGLALYGVEIRAVLRSRTRGKLDWALRYFFTAISLFIPLGGVAIILCWPRLPATPLTTQLENLYGFLAIVGVITFAILGMLHKIVPFLVWYSTYSREVGLRKVPSLSELSSTRLQAAGYWLFLTGLTATAVGTVLGGEAAVRWGSLPLAAGVGVFCLNLIKTLSHCLRPRREAPPLRTTPKLAHP
jgi:hypothetical protein